MSIEFTDKIDAFVLGQLSTDENAQFEAEMASNAALAQEVAEAQETYATLAMSLEPVEPSAGVLDRLMEAVSKTNRFEQFIDKIASVLQVGIEKAAEFLSAIDSPGSWELSALGPIELFHVQGGPALATSITGFVRLQPGFAFPMHTHLGEEKVVILQGSCRDEDGTVLKTGDYMTKAAGTAHSFTVLDGPTLIYLSVIEEGIQIGDQVIKYDSPHF